MNSPTIKKKLKKDSSSNNVFERLRFLRKPSRNFKTTTSRPSTTLSRISSSKNAFLTAKKPSRDNSLSTTIRTKRPTVGPSTRKIQGPLKPRVLLKIKEKSRSPI